MKWTRGVIRSKTVWADGLFTIQVEAPEVACFEAGQFLQLGLEMSDGHLHRPYSVASPHGTLLDFYIVLVEDGRLTPHLWKMEVGDSLDVGAKAAGSFTLSHCPDGESLWLIATGTGLAPYIAMLRTPEPWQRYKNIYVVHGVRHLQDLSYQDELAGYAAQYPGRFCYVPAVSRETGEGVITGRITHCLENGSLEEAAQSKLDQSCCVMMCGNPDMLNDLEAQLAQRSMHKHKKKEPGHVVVERYW